MKKVLALVLCLASLLTLFVGCGKTESDEIVLPTQVVEETYENRQMAMLQTARAYWYHNPYFQYGNDGLTVGGQKFGMRNAEWMNNTPEMATEQRSAYLVCSYYTYGITWHAFDLPLLESWTQCSAVVLGQGTNKSLQPYIVWHHTSDDNKENDLKALEEFFATVQVGDIVSYERKTNPVGHAAMWAGDVDGDGDDDILNVDGKPYDSVNGIDVREDIGSVRVNYSAADSARWFFGDPAAYDYFPKLRNVTILRPAAMEHSAQFPISERAKTRILYPELAAFFEAEEGIYGTVNKDGEYTFTLTLENHSQQKYENLLVQLPTPTNAEIIRVMGKEKPNKTLKMKLNIPAGEKAVIDYTVKATGVVGDIIETGVGYVGAIPLPNLTASIVSGDADEAKVKTAIAAGAGKEGEAFLAAYLKEMGIDAEITMDAILKAAYDRKNVGEYKVYMPKTAEELTEDTATLRKMMIPEYYGGKYIYSKDSTSLRTKEVRAKDLQAGDILIWKKDVVSAPEVAIHNGEALIRLLNGQPIDMVQDEMDALYIYHSFFALRPTQGI